MGSSPNRVISIIYLLYGGYTWLLVLQYFQEAVLATSMFQGREEGDLTLCNRSLVWFCIVPQRFLYLNVSFCGWFLWVLEAEVAGLTPRPAWTQSVFLPFCLFLVFFPSIDICVFSGVRPGEGIKRNRLRLSECSEKDSSYQPRTEKTHKQLMLHLSAGQRVVSQRTGFPRIVLLPSFPLSWEHAALRALSSDVVLDFFFCQVKRETLCCYFLCTLCFFLCGSQRTDPIWYQWRKKVLQLPWKQGLVFQSQSSSVIPSSLSALVPRCLIPRASSELGISRLRKTNKRH